MKKVMSVLAVVSMIAFCSCKSNTPAEPVEGVEETVTEEVMTAPVDSAAAAMPAETATPAAE
ncbi:MAG: hypothetical protein RRX93_04300 [Bacteroidales bacterium]